MLYIVTFVRDGKHERHELSFAQARTLSGYLLHTFGIVADVERAA